MGLKRRKRAERPGTEDGRGREEGHVHRVTAAVTSKITPYVAAIAALAILAAVFHSAHLGVLFENDRFFSHLSPLERELSFRTEMGLYYSYYKTIVVAPSIPSGLQQILWDNTTEYPSTINALRRFNVYPEVVLGVAFRGYRLLLDTVGWKGVKCFTIRRGYNQPPIKTCNGMGDPSYFYVYSIFALNGLMTAGLFVLGTYLSNNLLGGTLPTLMFLYNHGEATRVMWTPPLRESFALPFLTLQLISMTLTLRQPRPSWLHFSTLTASSLAFLLPWQFSQFTLLTQTMAVLAVYSLRLISPHTFLVILSALATALGCNLVLQFGNTLLLTSYFPACLLSCTVVVCLRRVFNRLCVVPAIAVCEVLTALLGTVGLKMMLGRLLTARDDAHIGAILLSKFTSYSDFHTQLYTCSAEFDFLDLSYPIKTSLTLLLPAGSVAMVMVGWVTLQRMWRAQGGSGGSGWEEGENVPVDHLPEVVYHTLQAVMFAAMATMIMRLKLFLTPQLALLTSALFLPKVTSCLQSRWRRWLLIFLLLASSVKGFHNVWSQWSIVGEFNNPDQEQLMLWINSSAPLEAVFAGSMPTMAAVKLSTGRRIVNHPHYEDAGLRNRTKNVYTIFSRKPPSEVHAILRGMLVDFVIVEDGWCEKRYRPGCAFYEVWDKEDPVNQDRPVFCRLIRSGTVPEFQQVFSNPSYRVLQLN